MCRSVKPVVQEVRAHPARLAHLESPEGPASRLLRADAVRAVPQGPLDLTVTPVMLEAQASLERPDKSRKDSRNRDRLARPDLRDNLVRPENLDTPASLETPEARDRLAIREPREDPDSLVVRDSLAKPLNQEPAGRATTAHRRVQLQDTRRSGPPKMPGPPSGDCGYLSLILIVLLISQ